MTTSTHTHHLARRHTAPKSLPASSASKHRNAADCSTHLPAGGPKCFPVIKCYNLPSSRDLPPWRGRRNSRARSGSPSLSNYLPHTEHVRSHLHAAPSARATARVNHPNAFPTAQPRHAHGGHTGGRTRGWEVTDARAELGPSALGRAAPRPGGAGTPGLRALRVGAATRRPGFLRLLT